MAAKKSAAKSKIRKKANTMKSTGSTNVTAKKLAAASKPYTKTEILTTIASMTGVARKNVGDVLESLSKVIEVHLKKGAAGVFILPGLLKCQVVHKPATRARKGINPFTGLETTFKAKPARNIVKVKALKKLKDMV